MSSDIMLMIIMLGASAIAVLCALGWATANRRYQQLLTRLARAQGHDVGDTDGLQAPVTDRTRLSDIERQMDALTQQLDRLAESQDFLSRVLTDRADLLADPRQRTPH